MIRKSSKRKLNIAFQIDIFAFRHQKMLPNNICLPIIFRKVKNNIQKQQISMELNYSIGKTDVLKRQIIKN